MAKQKYYVVWRGVVPGIYTTWAECEQQVKGVEGAVYKSFASRDEAEEAYYSAPEAYIKQKQTDGRKGVGEASVAPAPASDTASAPVSVADSSAVSNPVPTSLLHLPPEVTPDALAVDAACSGNPGKMEYRGVYLKTGQVVFHYGPVYGTNNIGEFLAIVHALALLKKMGTPLTIYSDSRNALLWVKKKKCRTTLARTPRTEQLYQMIERAERWLQTNTYSEMPLRKWETAQWGEIPADFGRK